MNTKLLQAVSSEQLKHLYSYVGISLLATAVIAPTMTMALWRETHINFLTAWLLAILSLTAVRYYFLQRFNRAPKRFSETLWLRLFLGETFLSGLLWGLLGTLFSPIVEVYYWFLVLFVLVGLVGMALATLSAFYFAYVLFAVPALLPMAILLLGGVAEYNKLMGVLILLYLGLTIQLSRRSNRDIDKTIHMRFEREAMSFSIERQIEEMAEQHERILETQDSLRRANEFFEVAFDTTHVMYAYLDKDFNYLRVNKAYANRNGVRQEAIVGKHYFDLYPDEVNKKLFEQVRNSGQGLQTEDSAFHHPVLGICYWDWSLQPLLDVDGKVMCLLLAVIDVTVKKQAQQAIEEKETYLQSIMDATSEVILTMDASGKIEVINSAVESMFGYPPEELVGEQIVRLMPESIANRHQQWVDSYMNESGRLLSARMLDTKGMRKDGTIFPVSISVSDNMIANRRIFTAVMRDITEQHNTMEALRIKNNELEYLSSHDSMTGLHNRRTADEILLREWNRAVRMKGAISLLMIDVDHFKKYNDHYGHQSGDTCLHRVATKMKSVLSRPTDELARYGGEEFIAILPDTDSAGALQVAENIRQAVLELEIPNVSVTSEFVTVSIGTGTAWPVNVLNFEKLVSCADQALYQAKAEGRNRVVANEEQLPSSPEA